MSYDVGQHATVHEHFVYELKTSSFALKISELFKLLKYISGINKTHTHTTNTDIDVDY